MTILNCKLNKSMKYREKLISVGKNTYWRIMTAAVNSIKLFGQ